LSFKTTKTKKDVYLRYLSANCGSRPICGPFSTFYWAAQHFLCCVAWAKTI